MRLTFCVLGVLFMSFSGVRAQQQPVPDPFVGNLFPPELVMQQQQTLGLSEEQKNVLRAELRKTQTRLTELTAEALSRGDSRRRAGVDSSSPEPER